jgi:tripartite-type tricarboxylate transporter receptor subunit TctC
MTTAARISRRAALALLCATPALAQGQGQGQNQGTWPDQPIRVVVPFPPGGPADFIARVLTGAMAERLGQPFVIESRSGAGGLLGTEYVAKSRPDGLTLIHASSGALSIMPHLMPRMSFDPRKDLAPIGQILAVPQIVAVANALPVRSIAELVALAKRQPGQLTYGSSGVGGSLHVAAEVFSEAAGIQLTHVPFRGAAPAVTELLAGRVQVLLADVPALQAHVREGNARAIGITSAERLAILPTLPTLGESGYPGVVTETWYGLLAPVGVPAERLAVLARAFREALRDPAVMSRLAEQGGRVVNSSGAEFAAHIAREFEAMGAVVRRTGMKLE